MCRRSITRYNDFVFEILKLISLQLHQNFQHLIIPILQVDPDLEVPLVH